ERASMVMATVSAAGSHTRSAPSAAPTRRSLPSGDHSTADTALGTARSRLRAPVAASRIATPPPPATATSPPSGRKATTPAPAAAAPRPPRRDRPRRARDQMARRRTVGAVVRRGLQIRQREERLAVEPEPPPLVELEPRRGDAGVVAHARDPHRAHHR